MSTEVSHEGGSSGRGLVPPSPSPKSKKSSDNRQDDCTQMGCFSMFSNNKKESPADPQLQEHLDNSDKKLNNEIKESKAVFAANDKTKDDSQNIIEKVKASGKLFIDPDFPPNMDSLFKIDKFAELKGESTSPTDDGVLPMIEWRRPSDFLPATEIEIFKGKIEFNDIAQGALGDCWLMCSIASISEFELLVKNLFVPEDNDHNNGLFTVKLCKDGMWQKVIMDSFIPCTPKGGPIYSKANGSELWVMLLEKAFAKYNGSYASIRSGFPYEAMIDLTGSLFI